MSELRNVERIIWQKKYYALKDEHGITFINLTPNDIVVCSQEYGNGIGPLIIPKGGYVAYLSVDDFFKGVPPKIRDVYYIVEYSLARVLNRSDLCIAVKCDFTDGKLGILPVKEPKRIYRVLG